MNTLWVILNADKTAVLELFETSDADSKRHWDKFMQFPQGTVFCRRKTLFSYLNKPEDRKSQWYVSYFYWEEQARWGYGDPKGMAWSACMALPEPLKMLEVLE